MPILTGFLMRVMSWRKFASQRRQNYGARKVALGSEEFKDISPEVWHFTAAVHYPVPLSSLTRSTWFPRAVSRGKWNMKYRDSLIRALSPGLTSLIDGCGKSGRRKND